MASENKILTENKIDISEGTNYFNGRPISLIQKNYGFMRKNLERNMGSEEYTYDGYWAPKGKPYDPYYKTDNFVPSYLSDAEKNASSNYIEYVKNIYGASSSVENINEGTHIPTNFYDSRVGTIDISQLYRTLSNDNLTLALESLLPKWDNGKLRAAEHVFTNPNGLSTDTSLGIVNGYELVRAMRSAIASNDKYYRGGFGITQMVYDSFGMKETAVLGNDILHVFYRRNPVTGRYEDLSPTSYLLKSPLDVNNFGNISTLGAYTDYYNSLSPRERSYYDLSVEQNLYRPSISVVDTSIINGDENYIAHLKIDNSYESLGHRSYAVENGLIDESFSENLQVRHVFHTLTSHTNSFDVFNGGLYEFAENEYGAAPDISPMSFNPGANFSMHASYGNGLKANDLLKKTNDNFRKGKYKTIIARFHTDYDVDAETNGYQTAVSKKYGMSHGRNLLKVTPDKKPQGYENPYCRVWTYHHQYHRLLDTIRPFKGEDDEGRDILISQEDLYSKYGFDNFTSNDKGMGNGRQRLEKFGVRNKYNGLVNITPISPEVSTKSVDVRNCMFSIENLAWKGAFSKSGRSNGETQSNGLSPEQKGPFGGRIMWFPPYGLTFNENVSANWNETNFIGRGEPIYTYTNSKREGNLSFILLIDHPSILNYWEGKGRSVSNSVDDIQDPEQQVLRFFAGCEMLTGRPIIKDKEAEEHISDDPEPNASTMKLSFFVFYPNDYSGVDDNPDDVMAYLLNGVGTGLASLSGSTNRPSDWFPREEVEYDKKIVGGYETIEGVSLINSSGSTTNDVFATKVSLKDNPSINHDLYVLKGETTSVPWKRRWYYRADRSRVNELLRYQRSYLDQASFGLNTPSGSTYVKTAYGISDEDYLYSLADVVAAISKDDALKKTIHSRKLCDEAKVSELLGLLSAHEISHVRCVGMASVEGNNPSDAVNNSRNEVLMKDRGQTAMRWMRASSASLDNAKVEATTGGTNGDKTMRDNTDDLINKIYRSARVDIYLKVEETKTLQNAEREYSTVSGSDLQQISVQQLYGNSFYNVGADNSMYYRDISANRNVEHKLRNLTIKDKLLHNVSENVGTMAMNLRHSLEHGRVSVGGLIHTAEAFVNGMKNGVKYDDTVLYNDYDNASYGKNVPADSSDAGYTNMKDRSVDVMSDDAKSQRGLDRTTANGNPTRYDGESRFFTLLEKEDPVMHSKITDKIKYFDPAFHSISPEGFNSRLTFLQQCTRQGPTVGASDPASTSNTANNLAFGRAPVCILRIGDFYYTRIIIHSLNIEYDPLVWDLNDEGIGVMPMMAKVSINFSFIGGSSLEGPISRLQNALSFNMYANTEVYDNRSEQAEYDENGKIKNLATYPPFG